MKQVLIKRGRAIVEKVPAPLVDDDGVLVEVAYSLISVGTEMASVEQSGKPLVRRALEQPEKVLKVVEHLQRQGLQRTVAKIQGRLEAGSPSGYSCSGTVIQVGQNVLDLKRGDRVACAGAGKANHAEIVMVPSNLVVKVPDGCDLREAASVTLGAIAMQGVRRADPRLGEIVAVIGLGLLGQITVQLLKTAGCRVIGFDLDERRVALANELGADHAFVSLEVDVQNEVRHLTDGYGVDSTIITAASQSDAIVQQAMEITRQKGRVVVVGAVGLGLKRSPLYEKELDFLISCSYGPGRYDRRYEEKGLDYPYAYVRWTENRNMVEYLRLVAEGKVNVRAIIEREYDVNRAPEAYEELKTATVKPLGVLLAYGVDESSYERKLGTKVTLKPFKPTGKINVAVIGAGSFAKGTHLPNLQKLSDLYYLRAIVSATGSNAKATAQQFGADYASTNYEDVLNDPDVDAVLICTRHHLHVQQTVAALKAGKHVYCEKPLALSEQELNSILACYDLSIADFDDGDPELATRNLQPVLMVGFNRRFSPAAQRMKEITSQRQNPLMTLYRVNAGYLPPDHWVHSPEGGGRIIGEGCHMFDMFNFLVDASVETVSAESLVPTSEHILQSDNVTATLRYADGSLCTLVYAALGTSLLGKEYLEVYVDGKVLVLDDFRTLHIYGSSQRGWKSSIQEKGHREAITAFARCVQAAVSWPINIGQLVSVSRVTLAIAQQFARIGGHSHTRK